jgi:asparagine synthase (glutamine-hydrolysing)
MLPPEVVWRDKAQFDEGSGTVDLLPELIKEATAEIDPVAYAEKHPGDHLRSAEECFYHQLLVDGYSRPEVILQNVGRWAQVKI